MTSASALLLDGFDYSWGRVRDRLTGLGEDEYLWEATATTWSVRREADGVWRVERHRPEPTPPPVTSIAWRTWHIASECLASYTSRLSGWSLADLPEGGREWYGDAAQALAAMDTAWSAFRDGIAALGDDGLARPLGPDWGPYAEDTWAALVLHAYDEVVHHGAEIALLRDLWAHGVR